MKDFIKFIVAIALLFCVIFTVNMLYYDYTGEFLDSLLRSSNGSQGNFALTFAVVVTGGFFLYMVVAVWWDEHKGFNSKKRNSNHKEENK